MKKHTKWLFYPLVFLMIALMCFDKTAIAILISNVIFSYYTAVYGLKFSALFLPIMAVLSFFFSGTDAAVCVFLYLLPSFIIGTSIYQKAKFSFMLMTASAAELVALTVHTSMLTNSLARKPSEIVFGNLMQELKSAYEASGVSMSEFGIDPQVFLNRIGDVLQTMLPTFYILFAAFCVYLLFVFVRFLLKKSGIFISHMPCFHELWLPGSIGLIFILLFLINLFSASSILANIVAVVFTLHVVCGLSTVDYFFIKFGLPKVARIVLITVIIFLSSFLGGFTSTILCCLGMNESARMVRK